MWVIMWKCGVGVGGAECSRLTAGVASRTFLYATSHVVHLPVLSLRPAKIVLIPTLVGLNLVMGWIASSIKLPIYLDSIGITLAAILAGPWVAVAVGVGTTLLGTVLFSPVLWAFSGTAALIGLTSAVLAERGFYVKWWRAIVAGLVIAIVAAASSAPVSAIVFGGATAGGVDAVTLFFRSAGNSLMKSVFLSGL